MIRVQAKQNRELYFSENLRPKMPLINPGPSQPLAIFCGCTTRVVPDLVGKSEGRFCHDAAFIEVFCIGVFM